MSEVKVNKISPRTACGTVTLGDSGDTITIPAGVTITNNGTQTGFGRTGTVDWQTSSIKTANFTAVSGEGYFCNTTGGTFEVDLPAGSAGAIIALKDYAGTWDTNNLTVDPNGSEKIGGGIAGETAILSTESGSVTLVYVDATQGWSVVNDATQAVVGVGAAYVAASGGTESCTGDWKIHTFTGPGSFVVSNAGNTKGNNKIDYMVVAGGGGGGGAHGSGGGAGGFRESVPSPASWTASPLANPAGGLIAVAQSYTITVGAGGTGQGGPSGTCATTAGVGSSSTFDSIQSAGGGNIRRYNQPATNAAPSKNGGSGSGVNGTQNGPETGLGNTPPVSPPQGNNGGVGSNTSPYYTGGGGGGAGAVGGTGGPSTGAPGGAGVTSEINGSPVARAGGGGGGVHATPGSNGGTGGTGGGGRGNGNDGVSAPTGNGTDNTGGGGGGGGAPSPTQQGSNGGSGIVILRYKYQN